VDAEVDWRLAHKNGKSQRRKEHKEKNLGFVCVFMVKFILIAAPL